MANFRNRIGIKNSNYRHGLAKHPLYFVYHEIRNRCNNKANKRYKDYGGRGIFICDEWNDFVLFYNWAINNGWEKGLEIDRIDNDKGYYPDNCRFVTQTINSRNRRICRMIEYKGKIQTLAEWGRELNLNYSMLLARVANHNLTPKELFERPNRYQKFKEKAAEAGKDISKPSN